MRFCFPLLMIVFRLYTICQKVKLHIKSIKLQLQKVYINQYIRLRFCVGLLYKSTAFYGFCCLYICFDLDISTLFYSFCNASFQV